MIEISKLLVDMVDLNYKSSVNSFNNNNFFNQTINGPKFPSPKLVVAMPKKGVFQIVVKFATNH
jgi:hypothetical protein